MIWNIFSLFPPAKMEVIEFWKEMLLLKETSTIFIRYVKNFFLNWKTSNLTSLQKLIEEPGISEESSLRNTGIDQNKR